MPPAPTLVEHHPATFRTRGVAAPFITPLLAGTRVRESRHSGVELVVSVELVVPNPSGGRGVYILNWQGVRSLCQPTVHDTVLFQRFSRLDTITPATVRDAALALAQEGYAGQEAATAARATQLADRDLRVQTHVLLLTRLMAQVEPKNAIPSPRAADFDARASAMLHRLAPRFGTTGAQLSNTLGAMADAYAPSGIAGPSGNPTHGNPTRGNPTRGNPTGRNAARVPGILERLSDTASELRQWLDASSDNDIAGLGDSVLAAMISARDTGEKLLDRILRAADDPVASLQRWTLDLAASQMAAMRCEWLLDGWEQLCLLWQTAATDATKRAALLEIAPLVPVLPQEALHWPDLNVPASAMEEACRVTSQQDIWRTGAAAFAMIERNEKLRAMSA